MPGPGPEPGAHVERPHAGPVPSSWRRLVRCHPTVAAPCVHLPQRRDIGRSATAELTTARTSAARRRKGRRTDCFSAYAYHLLGGWGLWLSRWQAPRLTRTDPTRRYRALGRTPDSRLGSGPYSYHPLPRCRLDNACPWLRPLQGTRPLVGYLPRPAAFGANAGRPGARCEDRKRGLCRRSTS